MTRPAHVLMLGVLFGLLSQTAIASQLEQTGKPEQKISVTKTYGVGVATAKALRTLVPEGWRTFIQPSVQLPESLSWDVGQEWTTVLAKLADSDKIAVHVDWAEKSVFIRTPGSTAVIGHVTADAATDAVTPLPRFAPVSLVAAPVTPAMKPDAKVSSGVAPALAALTALPATHVPTDGPVASAPATTPAVAGPSAEALVVELAKVKRELAESNAARVEAESKAENHRDALLSSAPELLPAVPARVLNAEPQRVETAAEMAVALLAATPRDTKTPAEALASTEDFAYTAPIGLNRPNARSVAQGIANKFHLRLVWAAPEYSLSGPVTLLGNAADEDTQLLGKAMGLFSPIHLEIPTGQGILLAVSKTGTYPDLAATQPKLLPPHVEPVIPALPEGSNRTVASIAVASIPAVSVTAQAPAKAEVAAGNTVPAGSTRGNALDELATGYVLVVNAGEPLELAIPRFARENGYSVEWKVSGGFEAKRAMTFAGESIKDVLLQVLPKLGVSADINKREAHIVVRPVDPARDF